MSVKFLIKQVVKISLCCFILSLSTIGDARADVCFLPKGVCENQTRTNSPCSLEYKYSEDKGEGWLCEECGGKWKCTKKDCEPGYTTGISCANPDETKKCEGKSGDQQCCKCADKETECFHEGYTYKKTSTNERCSNACPYDGDYYEICYCNSKYDKDRTEKCYSYNTCELGDLANTKKYEQTSSTKKCASYENNGSYNKTGDDVLNNNDYTCVSKCEETCTGITYYECSPKVTDACADGPYSWRDTECCSKAEWKDTKYCKKPTCTITAGGKYFSEPVSPNYAADFVPTKCDNRLKEGLGLGNVQDACYSRNTNYVLGMIRYCGGINDFAGLNDMNVLATVMYGRTITNNASSGLYSQCEIPANGLPKYDNLTISDSSLYNKVKASSTYYVRECYNGDEAGYLNMGSSSYGVNYAPVLTSNRSAYGMCVCSDGENADCTGCEYCIPSTCTSSGEKRIITDSDTYEKCADNCNGKYKCKSGYTPEYAGSNQYRCVNSNYATIRLSRDGGSDWPNASTTMMTNPIIDICGHSYDLTGEISTTPAEFQIGAGQCEILYGGAWYGNGRCYKQGRITLNGIETLDFTGTYIDNGSQDFSGCTCHSTVGRQVYNFEGGKTYNILVHSAAADCGSGSGGNDKVTVHYDAPTDCNPILMATNSANGHNTPLAATNQMDPGTYSFNFSSGGNGTGSSFTIRMGRGGTPSTYGSGSRYTFSAGNEYWIVPSCTSGGNSGGNSGGGSGGDSGGGSGGNDTYSVSISCMPQGTFGTMGGSCSITPSANAKVEDLRKITAWVCICQSGEGTNCRYTAVQVSSNSGITYGSGYSMSWLGCGIVKDPDGSIRDSLNYNHCQSSISAGGCSYKWEWHNYEFGY